MAKAAGKENANAKLKCRKAFAHPPKRLKTVFQFSISTLTSGRVWSWSSTWVLTASLLLLPTCFSLTHVLALPRFARLGRGVLLATYLHEEIAMSDENIEKALLGLPVVLHALTKIEEVEFLADLLQGLYEAAVKDGYKEAEERYKK